MALPLNKIHVGTAFVGIILGQRGLWYVEGHPLKRIGERLVRNVRLVRLDYGGSPRRNDGLLTVVDCLPTTEVADFEGPLDIAIKVRGYAPKRAAHQNPTHVLVTEVPGPKLDRGPRKIKLRGDL